MAKEGERPPADAGEGGWIFILLVDLFAQSATRLELSRRYRDRPVRDLLMEFAPSAQYGPIDSGVILNLTRRLVLRQEQLLNENSVADGDVLLFGDRADLERAELRTAQPEERLLSFEEARAQVSQFRQRSYTPQWVRCRVSDEQYDQLLRESMAELTRYEQFPDRRLLVEINRSIDENMRQTPSRPTLVDRVEAIVRFSEAVAPYEARQFLDQCGIGGSDRYAELADNRQVRFIGNTASLHLEPAPDIDENIVSLVEKGVIRIGQIEVYSGFVALDEDTSPSDRRV